MLVLSIKLAPLMARVAVGVAQMGVQRAMAVVVAATSGRAVAELVIAAEADLPELAYKALLPSLIPTRRLLRL